MLSIILNWLSGGLVSAFGTSIVTPILNAWMQSKNIDLQKLQATDASLTTISAAVLDANVKFAQTQEHYNLTILNWWPFRVLLFAILFFPTLHFCMAIADNSLVFFFNEPYGWFNVPALKGNFADYEGQAILFFIIAKPVDTAMTGIISLVSKYLK